MKPLIVTIDGPAASGKGTIAKYIKKEFGFFHLDSGLLYRKLAGEILRKKININKRENIKKFLKKINSVSLLSNKNLRSQKISKMSSEIAQIREIRIFVNSNQRKIVKENIKKYKGFVIDGRDIGSVVFKNASIKLYIETNPKIRAKRRHKELIDSGEKSIYSDVLKEIKLRDYKDKNRKYSPLVIPKNSRVIHNSRRISITNNLVKNLILRHMESNNEIG
ncbi:MAG: Cytidylate kinase [Alphaproteobacteria bacterium MarineAlpha5_Bin10]|nr:MAG: Cytidylate kinase [Alphaproteobacteria bacterium MarineAlpha5_Bin10]